MLQVESAHQQLKSFNREDWADSRVKASRRLPQRMGKICRSLLGVDERGQLYLDYMKRGDAQQKSLTDLSTLNRKQRHQVFSVLFPKLAGSIEAAWQLFPQLPYQTGGSRKAFRTSDPTATHDAARHRWLIQLLYTVRGYDEDVEWFATWANYLNMGMNDCLGLLFAAAINASTRQGEQVFDILADSARGRHPIGSMGRHVARALLVANRPDGWELMEQMLLAAQRQEGLRQIILETVDEAHPEAFRRMLRLIREQELTRFSATIRAVDVWFGFGYDAFTREEVDETLERAERYLTDPAARRGTLKSGDPADTYLALWALACEEASAAYQAACDLLEEDQPERRFVAVHLLDVLGLEKAQQRVTEALTDSDPAVSLRALRSVCNRRWTLGPFTDTELFQKLESILDDWPTRKTVTIGPVVWPWMTVSVDRDEVAHALLNARGNLPVQRILAHVSQMDVNCRAQLAGELARAPHRDDVVRTALFSLLGDRSQWVRRVVIESLKSTKPSAEEVEVLESLLTRKTSDLRRGVLTLLLNQNDKAVTASASRLLEATNSQQRAAGLELLRELHSADRLSAAGRALADGYRQSHPKLTAKEATLLDALQDIQTDLPVLEDGLGLFDPADRTPPAKISLKADDVRLITPAARACLKALDDIIHTHRTEPVMVERWDGRQEQLLGNLAFGFPQPRPDQPRAENLASLPLDDLWRAWLDERPAKQRDADGLELIRALGIARSQPSPNLGWQPIRPWQRQALHTLYGEPLKLRYPHLLAALLPWLIWLSPPKGAAIFLLNAVEATCALIPAREQMALKKVEPDPMRPQYSWRIDRYLWGWLQLAREHRRTCPEQWMPEDHARLYRLLRWIDEPVPGASRHRPELLDVLLAYQAGGATRADLFDQLAGERASSYYGGQFGELGWVSGRRPHPLQSQFPVLEEIVEEIRQRVIAVELERGDMPTAASRPALALRWSGGAQTLIALLKLQGRAKLIRGWTYDHTSRPAVFSHLIRATAPRETDAPQAFAGLAEEARISETRLLETVLYAPQWAEHIEHTLGWEGVAEAVWWIVAHTKDNNWRVDRDIRESWNASVNLYTPLSAENLLEGAVDVDWFWRVYDTLGETRWEQVYQAAKYASAGGGHKRAQLFADALLGRQTVGDLVKQIKNKRHRDSLLALGLVPLHPGDGREDDLLDRYEVIQEYLRTSRKFGAQRRENDRRAVAIALENLARGAGYDDPIRLQWAMERQAVAPLTDGPITVEAEGYAVTLSVTALGEARLETVNAQGRKLKRVPRKIRDLPAIAELREMKSTIRRQTSRMRQALEAMMVRGDRFSFRELADLLEHPVLQPMLEQLIFLNKRSIGYLTADGLLGFDGRTQPVDTDEELRLAHPYDLYQTGQWADWQRDCFLAERIQPFKQVFRELYLLTETEQDEGGRSRRYAGHQVNPRQALALLAGRGWVNHYEEGARRTFHDEGITAWVDSLVGWFSPAEVEGLTVETVAFLRRGEWRPMRLKEVPPRLFSEVMRDMDLVVSVAHAGGVDPEASASTVIMRAALVRETCEMLHLGNVTLTERHAAIEGQRATYSVHLGSGVVHKQPGGALCIIPVHGQHRGRLFLPFVDDDPKTAEVISKVILLARDEKVQDPTILAQILA